MCGQPARLHRDTVAMLTPNAPASSRGVNSCCSSMPLLYARIARIASITSGGKFAFFPRPHAPARTVDFPPRRHGSRCALTRARALARIPQNMPRARPDAWSMLPVCPRAYCLLKSGQNAPPRAPLLVCCLSDAYKRKCPDAPRARVRRTKRAPTACRFPRACESPTGTPAPALPCIESRRYILS